MGDYGEVLYELKEEASVVVDGGHYYLKWSNQPRKTNLRKIGVNLAFGVVVVAEIKIKQICEIKIHNANKKLAEKIRENIIVHSSEIRGFRSTKCSSETLQNLLYFMYKKTHVIFFVFHFVQLYFFP